MRYLLLLLGGGSRDLRGAAAIMIEGMLADARGAARAPALADGGRRRRALRDLLRQPMMRYWSIDADEGRVQRPRSCSSRIHRQFATSRASSGASSARRTARARHLHARSTSTTRNMRAELGYCLHSAYWGQGYMWEALVALIDHSFRVLKLRRLEADVDPGNASSLQDPRSDGLPARGPAARALERRRRDPGLGVPRPARARMASGAARERDA